MLGSDGVLKDTRFILVRAECPYIQFAVACVISTKKVCSRGSNGRERDRSQVSNGKVERTLRARLLLGYVLCVESIRPLSGASCPPFYRPRGEQELHMGERGKNQRQRRSFEGAGSSFSLEPALLSWQTMPGIACHVDPNRARLWLCFSEWSRPILPRRTMRCVRVPSHDSTGSRRGSDYTPVTIDDVSSLLDYSGCHMPMLVFTPEG